MRANPFLSIHWLVLLMQVFQHQILSDYILLLKSPIYLLADGILVDLAILVEKL